ncbi:DUF389 domain-containing protein [Demequina sediminicola]|uniref:DUF389 domain-containing protein n=1 Tax=Demequina sediminicola TaxID=1095026 RepID=UPI0007860135|nr:DUF389 domain-containing protein [Demequina sediminicola]
MSGTMLARDAIGTRIHDGARAMANPIAAKGLTASISGAAILLMPNVATFLVSMILFVAVAVAGVLDIVFSFTGKHRLLRRINKFFALLRGLVTLAFAVVLIFVAFHERGGAELGLELIVELLGIYVVVRGLIYVISALANHEIVHRGVRITGGITAIALGVISIISPGTVARAMISGGALAAIIFGLVLITWSLRRDEGLLPTKADPYSDGVFVVLWDWIRGSDIGRERREELADALYFESPARLAKRTAWWVMLILSVAIATFAVLADSTAVVIGAMLVAPLMVPILGLAGAIVNGWRRRALDSAVMVGLGVVASITLSYGLAAWTPVALAYDSNSQIVSRVNPTLTDMLIAIAAGAAGAFATVDKRVSASIAGVAIAVALVPPLSVVGVALGGGQIDDAFGAFLLFLTNFVAIVLTASVVFVLTGFARPRVLQSKASGILTTVIPFIALAAVILVPLMFTSQGLLSTASLQATSKDVVDEWLGDDTDLVVQNISVSAGAVKVDLIGTDTPPSAELLQDDFDKALGEDVEVTVQFTPVTITTVPIADESGGTD